MFLSFFGKNGWDFSSYGRRLLPFPFPGTIHYCGCIYSGVFLSFFQIDLFTDFHVEKMEFAPLPLLFAGSFCLGKALSNNSAFFGEGGSFFLSRRIPLDDLDKSFLFFPPRPASFSKIIVRRQFCFSPVLLNVLGGCVLAVLPFNLQFGRENSKLWPKSFPPPPSN